MQRNPHSNMTEKKRLKHMCCAATATLCLLGCAGSQKAPGNREASQASSPEEIPEVLYAEILKARARAAQTEPRLNNKTIREDKAAARASSQGKKAAAAGNETEAVSLLETALKLDPSRREDRRLLIDLLLKQKLRDRARRHIDSLPAPEDNEKAVIERARLYVSAEQYRDARALILDFLGSTPPENKNLLSLLVAAECAVGRPEAAFALERIDISDADAPRECAARISKASAR